MSLQQQVKTKDSLLRQGTFTRHIESVHLGHDLATINAEGADQAHSSAQATVAV
jgi:hypothetical protein